MAGSWARSSPPNGPDPEMRALLTFIVVGAGATGVEMAGQIAELATSPERRIPPDRLHEGAGHPGRRRGRDAAHVGRTARQEGRRTAEEDGHRDPTWGNGRGRRPRRDHLKDKDGTTGIESACKVWAAGVSASPAGPPARPPRGGDSTARDG